ncbi:hypothetical protein GCM10010211_41890 [Streptomyces albospinus]|uniref:Secreted protein n=1 Tax=Streptomyces albospinus TaxID=285515 RepID=A0ABQ2V741_9ACTN|nr:hypothetical protein GCM10010211_41890 [Streptomyces albospinus]
MAAVFFAGAFLAAVFFAAAFLAAAGFAGLSFTAASFASGCDAPDVCFAGLRPVVTLEGDLLLLSVFKTPAGHCSPTAESRPALTLSAPQSSALTGVLDTRPD